ncbi:BrnA antitoxin family protein [Candidatus Entotheonella palauensis]|uniref:BrnA antitoxin family protein n=1 Tax=Candidatus Entotheonella palauensis TaxID=93172 RepID=UPI000B7DA6C8|nr:BrnA antitoxin family protein [Candidatus Entotheonella palauensis]
MSKEPTSKPLVNKTDWKRVDAMADEDIQFDEDSPRTEPEDWAVAVVHQGLPLPRKKTQLALRLDSDVLAWFKAQGPGYQTRINAVLKAYKEAHEKTEAKA